ncbi:hypothetical protein VV869_03895 [Photobacterium sp. MCCC 1A19761]|uniref:hypothetical protein n=1 Tax=Photobacterium sp. MCCC 1A19761 TaxID=3115000 RepID=UPI00307D0007
MLIFNKAYVLIPSLTETSPAHTATMHMPRNAAQTPATDALSANVQPAPVQTQALHREALRQTLLAQAQLAGGF